MPTTVSPSSAVSATPIPQPRHASGARKQDSWSYLESASTELTPDIPSRGDTPYMAGQSTPPCNHIGINTTQSETPVSKPSTHSKRSARPRVKTEPQPEEFASDGADQAARPSCVKRGPNEDDSDYSNSERKPKAKAKRARSGTGVGSSQQKPRKGDPSRAPPFTAEEDAIILELYSKHNGNFKAIAIEFNEIRGRSEKQIHKRWFNYMQTQKKRQEKMKSQ
ncbi:hypothetical protein BDZ88DRAFT_480236 [Geranomyces variabilis]|nr:hypothetical protein BDZ88DRAFT_480236 [Geranomyces variabilis]KAJ3140675.1 hypothetical protein HDU90_007978 [Geranomyces variabilis]